MFTGKSIFVILIALTSFSQTTSAKSECELITSRAGIAIRFPIPEDEDSRIRTALRKYYRIHKEWDGCHEFVNRLQQADTNKRCKANWSSVEKNLAAWFGKIETKSEFESCRELIQHNHKLQSVVLPGPISEIRKFLASKSRYSELYLNPFLLPDHQIETIFRERVVTQQEEEALVSSEIEREQNQFPPQLQKAGN
jgi:hypothetical protein